MYTHIRSSCKTKKLKDEEKDEIYKKLLEIEEMKKKILDLEKTNKKILELEKTNKKLLENDKKKQNIIEKLEKKVVEKNVNNVKNVKNVNNGTINNENNNYNIILVGYGKEDLSKIDKKEILKAMQHGYDSTIKLTEALHFNPKHPEYNNVYITNMKDKYAMMFDGKDWNLTMKDDLINKIYDDKKNYIEENIDDFVDSLTVSRKKALDRWLDTDEDDDRITKIKNEINLLLYNKRNIILDKEKKRTKRIVQINTK
jgi:hypothetical protein